MPRFGININCKHFKDGSCLIKDKVFFGLFKPNCVETKTIAVEECSIKEPWPRRKLAVPQLEKLTAIEVGKLKNANFDLEKFRKAGLI